MKVGDKIVCINNKRRILNCSKYYPNWIKKSRLYTVREVRKGRVLLKEVHNPKLGFSKLKFEPGYKQKRFVSYSERGVYIN